MGQLCAQHCLNNLLQGIHSWIILFKLNATQWENSNIVVSGSFFDPVQLADMARKLDEAEKARLTEGDISTSQVLKVMEVRIYMYYSTLMSLIL